MGTPLAALTVSCTNAPINTAVSNFHARLIDSDNSKRPSSIEQPGNNGDPTEILHLEGSLPRGSPTWGVFLNNSIKITSGPAHLDFKVFEMFQIKVSWQSRWPFLISAEWRSKSRSISRCPHQTSLPLLIKHGSKRVFVLFETICFENPMKLYDYTCPNQMQNNMV